MSSLHNREAWLHECARSLQLLFSAQGLSLPDRIRISCGWPSSRGLRQKNRVLGECWTPLASKDGAVEIFVSPYLDDPLEVADTLIHELIHAAVGLEHGHRGPFKKAAIAIGLVGPMRATRAGDALRAQLQTIVASLGPYGHRQLNAQLQTYKRQSTRLLRVACPNCGYLARITATWVQVGLPTCPCGVCMRQMSRGKGKE
jgi:hypothetical protein